jgi:uncharacterized protein
MTLKRLILSLLTFFAIARVFLSLSGSLTEPQIQSKLELYQTNLVLYASELQLETENNDFSEAIAKSLGEDPTAAAMKKYDRTRQQAIEERKIFQTKLKSAVTDSENTLPAETQKVSDREIITLRQQIKKQVTDLNRFIDEIDLKRGILAATEKDITSAQEIWQQLITRINDSEDEYAQTALVLSKLWSKNPEAMGNAATIIQDNLDSWFRVRSLVKLYTVTDNSTQLATLNDNQQQVASQAIAKLALVSGIPVFGGLIGFILLISLLIQLLFKKEKSLLATNSNFRWETPWDWEITWQVIIIGFFFVGQFILPLVLGVVGFNLTEASLRMKALYVLFTYLLMAAGGILVLYLSIKPYLPLSQEWFKTKIRDRWFIWGFGGYLVAIPCVLLGTRR